MIEPSSSNADDSIHAVLRLCHHGLLHQEEDLSGFLQDLLTTVSAAGVDFKVPLDGLAWWRKTLVVVDGTPADWTRDFPLDPGRLVPLEEEGDWSVLEIRAAGEEVAGRLRFLFSGRESLPAGLKESLFLATQILLNRLQSRKSDELDAWRRVRRQNRLLIETARSSAKLVHDFGNLMTGLLGFAELAAGQVGTGSLASSYLKEILRSAQEGADWVRQLQLFTRGIWTAVPPLSVASRLRDLQRRWSEPGSTTKVRMVVEKDLPGVTIDPESFDQLVLHLVGNAREAMGEDAAVEVGMRSVVLKEEECLELVGQPRPGSHLELTVADSGPGLEPSITRRLAEEPFVSSKKRHRGLGIPVCFGILRTYGGGLRWDAGPSGGLVARVYLPVAETAAT